MYAEIKITDYVKAIKNLQNRFDKLQALSLSYIPESPESEEPFRCSGNFSVVFQLKDKNNNHYAVKCFTRERCALFERYTRIAEYLNQLNSQYFVEYEYLEKEIFITKIDLEFPVLKMSWVHGKTLGRVIQELCQKNDTIKFRKIYDSWDNICKYLLENCIGHGDLKHDNIIVTPENKLVLIDYDGMYVPSLKSFTAIETGGSAYQHPKRNINDFNETLDHFSMLVIKLSLYALIKKPELYHKYNTGENIIFSRTDFENIQNSPLILEIENINDQYLQRLVLKLKMACVSNTIENPDIFEIMNLLPKNCLSDNSELARSFSVIHKRINNIEKLQLVMNNKLDMLNISEICQHNHHSGQIKTVERISTDAKQKYERLSQFWKYFLSRPYRQKEIKMFKNLIQNSIDKDLEQIERQFLCDEYNVHWTLSNKDINQKLNNIITKKVFNFLTHDFDQIIQYLTKNSLKTISQKKYRIMKMLGIEKMKISIGKDSFDSEKYTEKVKDIDYSKENGLILNVLNDGYIYRETGETLLKAEVCINHRY